MNRQQYFEELKKRHEDFRATPRWQVFRKYMLASRCQTCEFCGKKYKRTEFLDVHHMFRTNYEDLDESRFMLLCKTCHQFLHKKSGTPLLGRYTERED